MEIASEQTATEASSAENYIKYTHCRYEIAVIGMKAAIRHFCHVKLSTFEIQVPYLTAMHDHIHTQDWPSPIHSQTRARTY